MVETVAADPALPAAKLPKPKPKPKPPPEPTEAQLRLRANLRKLNEDEGGELGGEDDLEPATTVLEAAESGSGGEGQARPVPDEVGREELAEFRSPPGKWQAGEPNAQPGPFRFPLMVPSLF